jgi:flagellar basal body-associated protein FliL
MGKLAIIAIAVVVVILVAGGVFLAVWDIPAPKSQVEKVIPDAKFPK